MATAGFIFFIVGTYALDVRFFEDKNVVRMVGLILFGVAAAIFVFGSIYVYINYSAVKTAISIADKKNQMINEDAKLRARTLINESIKHYYGDHKIDTVYDACLNRHRLEVREKLANEVKKKNQVKFSTRSILATKSKRRGSKNSL